MTQLIAVLFSLLVFHGIAMAEEAKEKGIFGKWVFEEVTNDSSNLNDTRRFITKRRFTVPESFIIESVAPDAGILTVKLPTQSEPRVYTFSKAKPTQHSYVSYSVKEENSFSLEEAEEKMEVIYIDDTTLKINWNLIKTTTNGDITRSTGIHTFVIKQDMLVFTAVQYAPNENRDSNVLTMAYKRQ